MAISHISGPLSVATGGVTVSSGAVTLGSTILPQTVTITPAVGAANVSLVSIQVKDGAGTNLARVTPIVVHLSDAATGIGLTGTTASGAVAAGASGTDLGVLTTKKANYSITDAAGLYILSITDTAKTQFYVSVTIPSVGTTTVTRVLTANYG